MWGSSRILALDIGESELKLGEFRALRNGGLELAGYALGSLGLEPNTDAERGPHIASAVRALLRENTIKPGPVSVSISGQMVFPRFVKLPPVALDKVAQIIEYEAKQNVPFPIDEVVWDHQLIGAESGDLFAMLMAIKKEVVEGVTRSIEGAGLLPQLVDVAPVALYNVVRYNYGELEGCTMIVDMGARTSTLVFVDGDRIFTRSIPVAGNVITREVMKEFGLPFKEAEELKRAHAFVAYGGAYEEMGSQVADRVSRIVRGVMTRLHAEVTRSINLYRSQQGGNVPGQVLLCGGTSVIPRTDAFFKEKMKLQVDYLNPFRNVAVSRQIGAGEIGKWAHVMGEVVGLALRRMHTCPVEIDLMPPSLIARAAARKRQPFFVLAAVGLLLTVLCWWGYFLRMRGKVGALSERANVRAEAIAAVDRRLQTVKRQAEDVTFKATQLAGLVERRVAWLTLLRDVRSRLPEGMWITSLKPASGVPGQEDEDEERGRGLGRFRDAADVADGVDVEITYLEISGMGFKDKVEDSTVDLFRDRLRESSHFSETTEFVSKPAIGVDEYAHKFTIQAILREPLKR